MERPIHRASGAIPSRAVAALFLFALGCLLLNWSPQSQADEIIVKPVAMRMQSPGLSDGLVMPFDRQTKRNVDEARKALSTGRSSEAVQALDRVLQRSEDFFYKPDEDKEVFRSIKAEAEAILGNMPEEARKSYDLQFGLEAQKTLADAAAAGDITGVAEVSRRFFHTNSGYEATLLLGKHHLDHGSPLAASLALQRLHNTPAARSKFDPSLSLMLAAAYQRAGQGDRAIQTLTELKKTLGDKPVNLGGKPVALFATPADAKAWIVKHLGDAQGSAKNDESQWAMFRGNPQRNAASAGGSPLLTSRWRVSTTNDPVQEKTQLEEREKLIDRGQVAIPAMHPLAVGDTVIMRTISNRSPNDTLSYDLLAVDFATGKRIWRPLPKSDDSAARLADRAAQRGRVTWAWPGGPEQTTARRDWEDATLGTMSSDGECVFYIDDLGLAPRRTNRGGRLVMEPASLSNKLVALELKTQGKLKWEIGGKSGEVEPQLAEAFFLGPPLPLGGSLYVLCEIKQQIRLAVLNPRTGKLLWSQCLAEVEKSVSMGGVRRYTGASPSFAEGMLICPTSAGAVVAVDLDRRSLTWGFQYPQSIFSGDINAMRRGGVPAEVIDRWIDATCSIAEGCVLITPVESDQIYCLDLATGSLRWKAERGENLYVGCVHSGKVLLVGRREVQAVSLATGKPVWSSRTALPAGAMPSGRGFFSAGQYYLPLTTAEVARIDVDTGKIVERVKSRKGSVPGNLICYKGEVISQGIDYLEAFFQLEPLKTLIADKLAKNPRDPWALTRRGQIELESGDPRRALADIRQAFEQDSSAPTRELLVEAMLGSLRHDFANQKGLLAELETLIDSDSQNAEFLRIKGEGLEKSGEVLAAFEAYMKLADLAGDRQELDEARSDLTIRRDRWVRGRLTALYASAGANREKVDKLIADRLQGALAEKSAKSLERFIAVFGDLPIADRARELLVSEWSGQDTLLARERLLRKLERSADPAQRRAATAQLALLLREADATGDAALYYGRLGQLGSQTVLGKRTGASMVNELPADSPIRRALSEPAPWPRGAVKSQRGAQSMGRSYLASPRTTEMRGSTSPFFDGMTVSIDQRNSQLLVGRDARGLERFRIQLSGMATSDMMGRGDFAEMVTNYAETDGHLLLLHLGLSVYAFDTLRPEGKLLWHHRIMEPTFSPLGIAGRVTQTPNEWGITRRLISSGPNGLLIPNYNALIGEDVILQTGREIVALDRLTGQEQWKLHGAPPGCELFGDETRLFIVPQDEATGSDETVEAMVVDPRDGAQIGLRKLPRANFRWATHGRQVLVGRQSPGTSSVDPVLELSVFDADTGESRRLGTEFHRRSQCALVEHNKVAVMEPSGKFYLFEWPSLKTLITDQLEPESRIRDGLRVFSDPERYYVVVQAPNQSDRNGRDTMTGPFGDVSPMVNGKVYAFSRERARKLWPVPAIVNQFALVAGTNSDLPALVFLRNINRSDPQEVVGSVLCLDKRTGRAIHHVPTLPGGISSFEVSADREAATMTVQIGSQSTVLRFTSDPIPPEPPFQGDLELPTQAASRRASKSGGFLFQRIIKGTVKEFGKSLSPDYSPPEE